MKLKINIPYIRCEKTTRAWARDEIYFAVYVAAARRHGDKIRPTGQAPVYTTVSAIQGAVATGFQWTPQLNEIEVDIGDAEAYAMTLALYECDDPKAYEAIKRKTTDPMPLKELPEDALNLCEDPFDASACILPLQKMLRSAFKSYRQDDLIAQDMITGDLKAPNLSGPRDLLFKGHGGRYHVLIDLETVEVPSEQKPRSTNAAEIHKNAAPVKPHAVVLTQKPCPQARVQVAEKYSF